MKTSHKILLDESKHIKLSYLNIANQAAEAERKGDYLKASQLWNKAKELARNKKNRNWAECRVDLNEKYNLLLIRTTERLEKVRKSARESNRRYKERNKEYRERCRLKKQAELLKANISKTSEVGCE